ncbi:MAG: hypothetical protein A3H42_00730 [Deltaproteobacteria bacterium RIFCSPLOWO2_02_FULL_46_8]|nr:MAG: hypothetical protein A3H42_00730 [Deltaproteobacteria bacterium RIFCSPLOWO2_02_FULL_46_8]
MDKRQLIIAKQLPLKKPIIYSLIVHILFFVFLFSVPKISLMKPKMKVVWVELPKGSSENLEIKMKEAENLPKTTIQEQKQAAQEEAKEKEMVKPQEKPLEQPKPEMKKPALRPIQPEKIAKPKPKPSAVQRALAALDKRAKSAPPEAAQVKDKGEGFKYGTGTQPLRVSPLDPEYVIYQAKLRSKIMQEWILPMTYLEGPAKPKASLIVQINNQGEIITTDWDTKSNNPSFDSSCLRAVQRASPLPVPPPRLEWEAYNEGFQVEFDPSLKMQ